MKTFTKNINGVIWSGTIKKLAKAFREYNYCIACAAGSFHINSYIESDDESCLDNFLATANKEIGIGQ